MNSEGEVYIMCDKVDEEWVSPTPVGVAISEAVVDATDLDDDDLDDLESYVDIDDLRALLDGDEEDELSFAVEGHEVTISEDGDIDVSSQ